jgi:hypothetical protein
MSVSDGDLQALLRTLTEQQTALVNAQLENARLQRVLIERLLGAETPPPAPSTQPEAPAPPSPSLQCEPATAGMRAMTTPPTDPAASDDAPQPGPIVASDVVTQPVATQADVNAPGEQTVPPISRGDRYYQARHSAGPPSVRSLSLDGLDVLRRIQAAGELAHLVLTFGPHAGETLGQVAQSDADYLRRLATTAQRPDVRAAAARLVEALPSAPPASTRKRPPNWRGEGRRGSS